MAISWDAVTKKRAKLRVHNKASAWSGAVTSAVKTFNTLGFPVQLVDEPKEINADVVVVLSNGADSYPHPQQTIKANFDATKFHGKCKTLRDPDKNEIVFAAVFLPGKLKSPTARQQEVVVVHELIHAAGLNGTLADGSDDPNGDHDSQGIMFPQMKEDSGGLIEYLPDKGVTAMTPIRVGAKTRTKINSVWPAATTAATTATTP